MSIRYGLMILGCGVAMSGISQCLALTAISNQFNKPDPVALAEVQSYKKQQRLTNQSGNVLVYYLTNDNKARKMAVRCHWSVPAQDLDEAFNDDANQVRSRIVIDKESSNTDLVFKLRLIDDTRTNERASLETRLNPSPKPITLANWQSSHDGQLRQNVVVIEYMN